MESVAQLEKKIIEAREKKDISLLADSLVDLFSIVLELKEERVGHREFELTRELIEARHREAMAAIEAVRDTILAKVDSVEKRISFLQWLIALILGIPIWALLLINLIKS